MSWFSCASESFSSENAVHSIILKIIPLSKQVTMAQKSLTQSSGPVVSLKLLMNIAIHVWTYTLWLLLNQLSRQLMCGMPDYIHLEVILFYHKNWRNISWVKVLLPVIRCHITPNLMGKQNNIENYLFKSCVSKKNIGSKFCYRPFILIDHCCVLLLTIHPLSISSSFKRCTSHRLLSHIS